MASLRMRPRFTRTVSMLPNQVTDRLRTALKDPGATCIGRVYERHAMLQIPHNERHYWSPQLSLSMEKEGSETRIHGLFAPRPAVWSMFIALYVFIGFSGVMGVIFGWSQWSIGQQAMALWAGPLAILLALGVYGLARVGQRLGYQQMIQLRDFTDQALKLA